MIQTPSCKVFSDSLIQRFGRGVIWNSFASIISQMATLLTSVGIAKILGQVHFGSYVIVQTTVLSAASFAQLATGIAARKYVAELWQTDPDRLSRILGAILILATCSAAFVVAILCFGARAILESVHPGYQSELVASLRLGSLYVPLSVLIGLMVGTLGGLEKYRSWSLAAFFGALGQLGGVWVFTLSWGVKGAILALLAGGIINVLCVGIVLSSSLRSHRLVLSFRRLGMDWSILIRFILPSALITLWAAPAGWLANMILASRADGARQLAIYSACASFRLMVMFVPNMLITVATSLLNNARGNRDSSTYWRVFKVLLGANGVFAVVSSFGMYLFGPFLLKLYGSEYQEGRQVLMIMMVTVIFESLALSCYQVIQSNEDMWLSLLFVNLPLGVILVAASRLLSGSYGASGLAFAQTLSWVVGFTAILSLLFLRRRTYADLGASAAVRAQG